MIRDMICALNRLLSPALSLTLFQHFGCTNLLTYPKINCFPWLARLETSLQFLFFSLYAVQLGCHLPALTVRICCGDGHDLSAHKCLQNVAAVSTYV